MIVHFDGAAISFADLSAGAAFVIENRGNFIGVKATRGDLVGAVILTPGFDGNDYPLFIREVALAGYSVLRMADVRLVPSSSLDDMNLGGGINCKVGFLYFFPNEAPLLAFSHGYHVALLNLNSGEVRLPGSFHNTPIEIRRWALATEIWGKPMTLLTYPIGSPAMDLK